MNLQLIIAISEAIGAIALLITLIYLAVQVRQNTRSVHAATFQAISDCFNNLNITIA